MIPLINTRNFLSLLILLPLIQSITLSQEDVRKLCREARIQEDAEKDAETIIEGLSKAVESKLINKAVNNQTGEMDKLLVKSLVGNLLSRGFSGYGLGAFSRKVKVTQKISNEKDAVAGSTNLITLQNPTVTVNDLIDRVESHDSGKNSQIYKKFLNLNIQTQVKRESGWEPLPSQITRSTGKTKSSATSELIEKCANIRLPQEMDSTRAHKWWTIMDLVKEQLEE
ncbi:uncharacterized protein LOC141858477 [Brevipalpus obovatus]|uniref:uncharacterized protein LOC141858477 n=1 Tax=Brevipalpus obovatus TaxID=246614 RepID=UPI003D9E727B